MYFVLKSLPRFFTALFFTGSLGGSGARSCEGHQCGSMCPALERERESQSHPSRRSGAKVDSQRQRRGPVVAMSRGTPPCHLRKQNPPPPIMDVSPPLGWGLCGFIKSVGCPGDLPGCQIERAADRSSVRSSDEARKGKEAINEMY